MKFRITRKLTNYKEDRLVIQVKKWWYITWKDLYYCKEEPDGDEFYQVQFQVGNYLEAKDFITELIENPEKVKKYYISVLNCPVRL